MGINKNTISTAFHPKASLGARLEAISAAGFDSVVISEEDGKRLIQEQAFLEATEKEIEDLGLKVAAIMACPIDAPNSVEAIGRYLELAVRWHVPLIIVNPYRGFDMLADFMPRKLEQGIATLRALSDTLYRLEQTTGQQIHIAVRNVHPDLMDAYLEGLFNAIVDTRIGLCYDVTNDHFAGHDAGKLPLKHKDRVKIALLSDRSEGYADHQLPGEGYVFFPAICGALRSCTAIMALVMDVRMEYSHKKDPMAFLHEGAKSLKLLAKQIAP